MMAMNGVGAFFDGFNQSYDSVGRVMRDAELAKIAKAGVKPLPGQVTAGQAADLQAEGANDPGAAAALQPNRYEFLGKTYDASPDEPTMTRDRQLAMAGVFEKYGEVAQGMGMRREVRRDQLAEEEAKQAPLRRRSLELGVQQQERAAQDDQARRDAEARSQQWWSKRLTSEDGSKRAATPKDFTDFSQQRVYDLIESGRMDDAAKAFHDHSQQAFVQIQLDTAQRKSDGEKALQALYQGNTDGVLGWYNRYAPDGAQATGVKFNKDGSVQVERKAADGKPVPPMVFKGGTAEMAASIKQAFDPNAMYQWSQTEFHNTLALRQDARAGAAAADSHKLHGLQIAAEEQKANDLKEMRAARTAVSDALASGNKEAEVTARKQLLLYATGAKGSTVQMSPEERRALFYLASGAAKDEADAARMSHEKVQSSPKDDYMALVKPNSMGMSLPPEQIDSMMAVMHGADWKAKVGGMKAAPAGAPKRGDVVDGYRFSGGDPKDQKNWVKVPARAASGAVQ